MGLKGHPRNLHAGEALQAPGVTPEEKYRNVISALGEEKSSKKIPANKIVAAILSGIFAVGGFFWLRDKPKQPEKKDDIENRQTPFPQSMAVSGTASEGNWRAEEEKWRRKALFSDKETNSTPQR